MQDLPFIISSFDLFQESTQCLAFLCSLEKTLALHTLVARPAQDARSMCVGLCGTCLCVCVCTCVRACMFVCVCVNLVGRFNTCGNGDPALDAHLS